MTENGLLTDFEMWAVERWFKLPRTVTDAAPLLIVEWIDNRTDRITATFIARTGAAMRVMVDSMQRLTTSMTGCSRSFSEFSAAIKEQDR